MITEADLKKFAPKMRAEYKTALLSDEGQECMASAGIFENELRESHFMATFGAETDYGRVIRESLYYTSAKRLREVWPSRFRNKSDALLRPLLKNERALGDSVYGGRMGNGKNNGDGYVYRGGGPGQTTGKEAVRRYAEKCGLACDDAALAGYLDDCLITLKFICHEWVESGCNKWADENSTRKVAKAINTGSANSNIEPVGMDNRKAAFAKAWGIWGGKGKPDNPKKKKKVSTQDVAVVGGGGALIVKAGEKALDAATAPDEQKPAAVVQAPPPAPEADTFAQIASGAEKANQMQAIVTTGRAVSGDALSSPLMWVVLFAVLLGIWFVVPLINRFRGTS